MKDMSEGMIYILIFILGTIVGSFLNVVILRLNTGKSIFHGRSGCFSCGHKLGPIDLVPILSFLFLFGRCRYCKSRMSIQYPIVEILSGVLFASIYHKLGFSLSALLSAGIFSALIVIAVYDFRHKIIPEKLSFTFAALSLLHLIFFKADHLLPADFWLDFLAGPLFFLPFFLLWRLSNGRLMGLGDGKLAVGIGWLLGLSSGAAALILSFWLGAAVGLLLMLISRTGLFLKGKPLTMKSELPFGPFLILGTAIAFFTGIDFITLALWFS